jgi:hypothetical protein
MRKGEYRLSKRQQKIIDLFQYSKIKKPDEVRELSWRPAQVDQRASS